LSNWGHFGKVVGFGFWLWLWWLGLAVTVAVWICKCEYICRELMVTFSNSIVKKYWSGTPFWLCPEQSLGLEKKSVKN